MIVAIVQRRLMKMKCKRMHLKRYPLQKGRGLIVQARRELVQVR